MITSSILKRIEKREKKELRISVIFIIFSVRSGSEILIKKDKSRNYSYLGMVIDTVRSGFVIIKFKFTQNLNY